MNNIKSKTQRVSELDRLENVIKALRDHGFSTVREVALFLQVDKKTAHRYMKFLVRIGWASVTDGRNGGHTYMTCDACCESDKIT